MAKTILIAEGNDSDALAIGQILTTAGIKNSSKVAGDGTLIFVSAGDGETPPAGTSEEMARTSPLLRENELPTASKIEPGVVLAIEDDSEDVELLHLALAQGNFPCKLVSVPFARDAIRYLGRIGEYADETRFPRPMLIILDLSLPGMSGMDFLTWAGRENNIPPIVILTYSRLKEDRELAQRLGAKAYFVKSLDLKETTAMLETLRGLALPPILPGQTGAPQTPQ